MSIETITGLYAFVTFLILLSNMLTIRELRKQNESFMRPYIHINAFVPTGSIILYLRIRNQGRSTASNVKLTIDRDFFQYGGSSPEDNFRSFPCFNNVIADFPADAEFVFALAQSFVVLGKDADKSKTPTSFIIDARYDWASKHFDETTTIDLNPYLHSQSSPDPIHCELEGIKEELAKMQRKFKQ